MRGRVQSSGPYDGGLDLVVDGAYRMTGTSCGGEQKHRQAHRAGGKETTKMVTCNLTLGILFACVIQIFQQQNDKHTQFLSTAMCV